MRRRELLAGVGSVGILGAAGAVALGSVPSTGGNDGDQPTREPMSLETLDAPGSEAGTVGGPATGEPTFVDFFATWCDPCVAQMPALAEANDRVGEDVLFLSVTAEGLSDDEIVEWWERHDGEWLLARDPTAELAARYNQPGIPYGVAIDAAGTVQWSEPGAKTADELVEGIERALDVDE